ncbi:MAG TPA: hypothetical protein VHY09_12800 [Candidatus Methylacidiphilales bacterium]|nr:hypothetical protein [Candidatus Methylacidiphilales bacterium]
MIASISLWAALSLSGVAADVPLPQFTVGPSTVIPVLGKKTWYVNDSVYPLLRARDVSGVLAFWGDGIVMRYAGPDIKQLTPPENSDVVTATPAPGVATDWRRAGNWMLTATRRPDGTLVGFVHGENHTFADGKYGEWNSTGVWTSADDGVTWTDWGVAEGAKQPEHHGFGGLAMNECIWDAANKRWLGYSGPYPLISTDPLAKPGTWFGYRDGAFSQPIDAQAEAPKLSPAPGLEKAGVSWGGLTYNSYLKQYIMTWVSGHKVMAAFGPDGLNWNHVSTLFDGEENGEPSGGEITYAFLVGDTDTSSGQDCWLVYMYHPPGKTKTVSGHNKDMVQRPVHFEL